MASVKPSSEYEQLMKRVRERADKLRSSPGYDPRKEREIDELYNQYVPPYAVQENSSLIDIAERDAYVNAFPPLGSQKKGGIVIKKTIRSAIGWYMQFVTQQISTFGSGVARALRAMNEEIEDLKKNSISSSDNQFVYSLELSAFSENFATLFAATFSKHSGGPILVSDSVNETAMENLRKNAQIIVVDPNPRSIEILDPTLDIRNETLMDFLGASTQGRISGAILSGTIECLDPKLRYRYLQDVCYFSSDGATVAVLVSRNVSADQQLACEVLGTSMWGRDTWEKVMNFFLDDVVVKEVDTDYVLLSGTTRSAG